LHHPAKTEGSTGRGSSAIRGACDLAFLHSLDKESDLITLKLDKNRLGACRTITVRADFEEGKYEMADAPYVTRRNDELDRLQKMIEAEPGMVQNTIYKKSGMKKSRLARLLQEGTGTRWRTEKRKHGSICYFTCSPTCSQVSNSLFPKGEQGEQLVKNPSPSKPVPLFPPLLGGNRGTGCEGPEMSACPNCGSFAIYRDSGVVQCMTCDAAVGEEKSW